MTPEELRSFERISGEKIKKPKIKKLKPKLHTEQLFSEFFDFSVLFPQYIEATCKLYGYEPYPDLEKEYEAFCKNREIGRIARFKKTIPNVDNGNASSLASSSGNGVAPEGKRKRKKADPPKGENLYAKEYKGRGTKRRPKPDPAPEPQNVVPVRKLFKNLVLNSKETPLVVELKPFWKPKDNIVDIRKKRSEELEDIMTHLSLLDTVEADMGDLYAEKWNKVLDVIGDRNPSTKKEKGMMTPRRRVLGGKQARNCKKRKLSKVVAEVQRKKSKIIPAKGNELVIPLRNNTKTRLHPRPKSGTLAGSNKTTETQVIQNQEEAADILVLGFKLPDPPAETSGGHGLGLELPDPPAEISGGHGLGLELPDPPAETSGELGLGLELPDPPAETSGELGLGLELPDPPAETSGGHGLGLEIPEPPPETSDPSSEMTNHSQVDVAESVKNTIKDKNYNFADHGPRGNDPDVYKNTILIPTNDYYTDKEFTQMREELEIALTEDANKLKLKEYEKLRDQPGPSTKPPLPPFVPVERIKIPEKDPKSKYKVQKYKFVSNNNMIETFIDKTYPSIIQKMKQEEQKEEGDFRSIPPPKIHDEFIEECEAYNRAMVLRLKAEGRYDNRPPMSDAEFEELLASISPRVGKSYHDVQIMRNPFDPASTVYLPSSFPSSYCEKSRTLSFIRDNWEYYAKLSNNPKLAPSNSKDGMIRTYAHLLNTKKNTTKRPLSPNRPNPNFKGALGPIDLIFTATIFHPIGYRTGGQFKGDITKTKAGTKRKLHQYELGTLELLGSDSFGVLRNFISCHFDNIDTERTIKFPQKIVPVPKGRTTRMASSRAVFLVEDKIFTEMSDPQSLELANIVKGFLNGENLEIKDSLKTRFRDMRLRFGVPYLYIHQDNCQHVIKFHNSGMYYPKGEAPEDIPLYPRFITKSKVPFKCRTCSRNPPRWKVCGSEKFPNSSAVLCSFCCKHFFFNEDGNLREENAQIHQFNGGR